MSELSSEQRRLREKKRNKKRIYLFIFVLILWTIINVSIWSIWGFDFKNEGIIVKTSLILTAVFSLVGFIFLFNYLDNKISERERRQNVYRFR